MHLKSLEIDVTKLAKCIRNPCNIFY